VTLVELLGALLRRWPVTLLGAALSLAFAYQAAQISPVYLARSQVAFTAPQSLKNPNELVTQAESVINTAGIVAKRIEGPAPPLLYASVDVNPVGAPTGGDTWIRLPHSGSQWVPTFDDQVLLVDTVGDTPERARSLMDAATLRIAATLDALQRGERTDPINDISTLASPVHVTQLGGSRTRATGMTLLIGMALTGTVVVGWEVLARRRPTRPSARRRRERASTTGGPAA